METNSLKSNFENLEPTDESASSLRELASLIVKAHNLEKSANQDNPNNKKTNTQPIISRSAIEYEDISQQIEQRLGKFSQSNNEFVKRRLIELVEEQTKQKNVINPILMAVLDRLGGNWHVENHSVLEELHDQNSNKQDAGSL